MFVCAEPPPWPDPEPPSIGYGGEADVALIVAIEDYPDIPDIPGAVRNARAWERYFRQTLGLRDVVVLLDKEAAHYAIRHALKDAAARATASGGKLWFVFIGHGAPAQDGSDGLLVGAKADASAEGIYENSLPRAQVMEVIAAHDLDAVVVLDACFSGAYGASQAPIASGLQPLIPVKALVAQGSVLILSAGRADQLAGPLPGDQRPAFSYLLIRALSGEADADLNGQVSAGEAMVFTTHIMESVALGRAQDPQMSPPEHADWVLTPQADPSVGCPSGQARSADTAGQCCWPGQAFSQSQGQCIGQPTRCPAGLARRLNGCGPCDPGQTLQGDTCTTHVVCPAGSTLQNGVCVQVQIVDVQCPAGFILYNHTCVEKPRPKPSCPEGTHLEGDTCVENKTSPGGSSLSTWGWISVGSGVVIAGVGAGLLGYASTVAEDLKDRTLLQTEANDKDQTLSTLNLSAMSLLGLGGASLVAGLVLLLSDNSDAPTVNLSSDGQNTWLTVGGRF